MTSEQIDAAKVIRRIKDRIDSRLNDVLYEMKPDYDDSIVGFNEAWDIVRKIMAEEIESAERAAPAALVEIGEFRPCVVYNEELRLTEMLLEDTMTVWQPWGHYGGHTVDLGYSEDGRLIGIRVWDDIRNPPPQEAAPAAGDLPARLRKRHGPDCCYGDETAAAASLIESQAAEIARLNGMHELVVENGHAVMAKLIAAEAEILRLKAERDEARRREREWHDASAYDRAALAAARARNPNDPTGQT